MPSTVLDFGDDYRIFDACELVSGDIDNETTYLQPDVTFAAKESEHALNVMKSSIPQMERQKEARYITRLVRKVQQVSPLEVGEAVFGAA